MVHNEQRSEKPLVSIGIPTYNRPIELRRILRQLLSQSYQNIEIIILDNCSTINEVEQAAIDFSEKYTNVKYFKNEKNLGVLKNAAELINYANGEYFCWVSDDDYRSDDFIEKTVKFLQGDKQMASVFCDFREVDKEGIQYANYPVNHSKLMWFFSLKTKWLRRVMYYFSSSACGKCNAFYALYRIDVLKKMNFSELSDSYTALNMDCMIVYQSLAVSPVVILNFEGCLLTVGNKKNYGINSKENIKNTHRKVLRLLSELNKDRKRYCQLSDPVEKVFINLLFPAKVVVEIIMAFLKKKCCSPFVIYAKETLNKL